MVEKLKVSKAKAAQFAKAGARTVDKKSTPAPKKAHKKTVSPAISEAKRMAQEATDRATEAQKAAQNAQELMFKQQEQMQLLIDKMPAQDNVPPIVGFEFIRDSNDVATGVRFIRAGDKRGMH